MKNTKKEKSLLYRIEKLCRKHGWAVREFEIDVKAQFNGRAPLKLKIVKALS